MLSDRPVSQDSEVIERPQDEEPQTVPPQQVQGLAPEEGAKPWGFWITIALSVVIAAEYTFAQTALTVVVAVAAVWRVRDLDLEQLAQDLARNGFLWSVAVIIAAPVTIGLTLLFTALARDITVRDYLALQWRGGKGIAKWCVVLLLFVIATDLGMYLLHGRVVPESMEKVYATAYFPPLLWFAFVVIAPVTEELFFRGFMFKGIRHSAVGPAGAVVLTSLAWALMHAQYDLYGIAIVFLGGLLLGYARLRSGSLYVPIVMHVLQNIVATFEVACASAMPNLS